jgi:hypothetical protein
MKSSSNPFESIFSNPTTTRANWRERVRTDLVAAGLAIETLPSGLTRITSAYGEHLTVSDLSDVSNHELGHMIHRSFR